jgi:hypothetical protein
MADNVLVSFDEEKLMNDILDQGINELKKSNPHTKSNSFNKTNISNFDYNPKNDLIVNKKLANFDHNSNGSNALYQKKNSGSMVNESESKCVFQFLFCITFYIGLILFYNRLKFKLNKKES